jgi:hypothetical protein
MSHVASLDSGPWREKFAFERVRLKRKLFKARFFSLTSRRRDHSTQLAAMLAISRIIIIYELAKKNRIPSFRVGSF